MRRTAFATALVFFILVGMPSLAISSEWLHVSVQKAAENGESVRVNLPLSVARAVIPMLEMEINKELDLNDHKISLADMRQVWTELRKEKDTEFVQVDTPEANVRVSLSGRHVLVRTEEGSKAEVDVKIPVEVVDALLSGDGNSLNITAALDTLIKARSTELVSVRHEEGTVKVWIDDRNQF